MENNLKCPNCGSENIQFGTSTSGGGFSFSNSCCGYIMLGPLGLLCGACGSGTSTEEFWICQGCGHKFSNRTAKKAKENEEKAEIRKELDKKAEYENYLENKKKLKEMLDKYGSIETIEKQYATSKTKADENKEAYDLAFKSFVESSDKKVKKMYKLSDESISNGMTNFIAISFVIAIVLCFFGLFPVAIPIVVLDIILFIFSVIKAASATTKIKNLFFEANKSGKNLYENMRKSEEEFEEWQNIKNLIESVEAYEKENTQ